MNRRDATLILATSAIAEGDHESAREELNELTVAELRELVALAGMLSYLANETIDDKPRDLEDEANRLFFSLRSASSGSDGGSGGGSDRNGGGGAPPR